MRTITRDIVGAFVFSNDNKTLLGLHGQGSSYAGRWVVIGGGVGKGETKKQALQREFLEEASLDLPDYDIKFVDQSGPDTQEKVLKQSGERVLVEMLFFDFEVHIDKPASQLSVVPNDEFDELRWIGLTELKSLNVAPITRDWYEKWGYIS
jgi:8-oxo-dGTP pyrophosphatase MutT (NUDIX family)